MTAVAGYTIRSPRDEPEMETLLRLRHDVFCGEQGVPVREEQDGRDREATHLIAVSDDDGDLLATCRLLSVGSSVQFSRLAVRADARRRGIASALLVEAEAYARTQHARRIVLHAQTYARRLYELAGYRPRGREFVEAAIEHIAMEKTL